MPPPPVLSYDTLTRTRHERLLQNCAIWHRLTRFFAIFALITAWAVPLFMLLSYPQIAFHLCSIFFGCGILTAAFSQLAIPTRRRVLYAGAMAGAFWFIYGFILVIGGLAAELFKLTFLFTASLIPLVFTRPLYTLATAARFDPSRYAYPDAYPATELPPPTSP